VLDPGTATALEVGSNRVRAMGESALLLTTIFDGKEEP
jgi:hypothetical protein